MSDASAERRPWFTMPADEVAGELGVDPGRGLAPDEAASRLEHHGRNKLLREQGPSGPRIFWKQLSEPLIIVLILAAAASAMHWFFDDERPAVPYDAIVITAIVVLNTLLGFFQEYRAERAIEALRQIAAPQARVRRDGREQEIAAEELVPGDVLLLESGNRVPADVRLMEVTSLKAEEAALTGESVAVSKQVAALDDENASVGDRTNMVFMGTSLTYGRGLGVVVGTGMHTEVGGIAQMLQASVNEPTPLQRQLGKLGKQLGLLVLVISAVVALAIVLRGDRHAGEVFDILLFAVALAVAAVPEGLPAVVTASLAVGVQRLARRHAIVRRLPAVETLGSTNVICTDKTGTVTRNEMTVTRLLLGSEREIEVSGRGFGRSGEFRETENRPVTIEEEPGLLRLLRLAALNNDAEVEQGEDGQWSVKGDATEAALVVLARKGGVDPRELRAQVPREGAIPFSGERKRMTTIHTLDGERTAVVKGGPELIIERCTGVRDGGQTRELDEETRAAILQRNERFAKGALRTLAVASRRLAEGADTDDADAIERDLVLEGIVGMLDPPRESTRPSVEQAATAGIRTVLLTGDHVLTARAIAHKAGIAGDDAAVLSGRDVSTMSDEDLQRRVSEVTVYGRVGPEEKLRILRALKARGCTVAMTGDGVNDAPAVKEADIGVSMGRTGTDVTRDASDLILTDDNFATIVAAVSEGRRVFTNIRAFVRYLLSANTGEVLTIFAAVMLSGVLDFSADDGTFLPLLATQILWINLVTDGPPALALGMGPADPGQMQRPPRAADEGVINRPMWVLIATVGTVIMIGSLFVLDAYLPGGFFTFMVNEDAGSTDALRRARTAVFTTLFMFQMFNVFNCLSQWRSVFGSGVPRHYWLLGAVAVSLALHAAVIYWSPLQTAFQTVPLTLDDWLVVTTVAASVIAAVEVLKLTTLVRDPHRRPDPGREQQAPAAGGRSRRGQRS